jgi:DNA-binding XRE family transcriptional regulator
MAMTGAALKRSRMRPKLTQVEMAKKIGVHSNSLARMERGEMTISEPVSRLVQFLVADSKNTKR